MDFTKNCASEHVGRARKVILPSVALIKADVIDPRELCVGCVVDQNGLVVTSAKGLDGREDVWIELPGRHHVRGHVVSVNSKLGLALLETNQECLRITRFKSAKWLRPGDFCFPVGSMLHLICCYIGGTIDSVTLGRIRFSYVVNPWFIRTPNAGSPVVS